MHPGFVESSSPDLFTACTRQKTVNPRPVFAVKFLVFLIDPGEAASLIREGGLLPAFAIGRRFQVFVARLYSFRIGDQRRGMHPADFCQQGAEYIMYVVYEHPSIYLTDVSAQVIDHVAPGVYAWRIFEADCHRGRIKLYELGQLSVETSVRR
jgi:hypothetical protein